MYFSIRFILGVFYFNINIILSNIVFDVFLYSKEIEIIRYFLKYLFNFLIPIRAFYFIINFINFVLGINQNIDPFLKSKETKIYFFKLIIAINIFEDLYYNFIFFRILYNSLSQTFNFNSYYYYYIESYFIRSQ